MASRRGLIRHVFGGGWAEDFGPEADVALQQVSPNAFNAVLPFLVDAQDVLFGLDGSPTMAPGTAKLNSSALESQAPVRAIHDYWRQGAAGSPTQKRVIAINDHIYKDDADGSFTSLKSGLSTTAVTQMSTFDDLLIIANDATADVPMSWDQTTFQNLAGSPPNFAFSAKHNNVLFAAGVAASPSTLFYSKNVDPEDWTEGGGTTGILIDPDDGDAITAIISHRNELIVFKGPHKGSIHRITGTSSSDFARKGLIEGIGAVGMNSVFRFAGDVGFLWSDGTVRSLRAVEQFGDYQPANLSLPIDRFLKRSANQSVLNLAQAAVDTGDGVVYISIALDTSSTNNVILAMDFRFSPVRWSKLTSFTAISLARVIDTAASNEPIIFIGGDDGFVRKWGQATRSIDGDTALNFKVTTPFLSYSDPHIDKALEATGVGLTPKANANITFGWARDGNAQQTVAIAQGGSDVLGDADANEFTLNTSTLGGGRFVNRWSEAEEGGDFRSIQYQVTSAVNNVGVELHSIMSVVSPGGENLEND
jgi:hypothetical protein|tara:strand:+ start:13990 stop:15591 length:1602 start_codon:yes stop_codon:yes gene_type:complete